MKTLRIGLVGLPSAELLNELQTPIPGLELVAAFDPLEVPAALIARSGIDAIVLASPVADMVDLVETAAAAGKPVLLDGAMVTTLADADRIVSASRKAKVLAGYLPRFASANREVHEVVSRGAIGRLTSGFYSRHAPIGLSAITADVFDCAAPFADLFRWISGSEPRSVMASVARSFDPLCESDTYGIATFTMLNGATLTFESTTHVEAGARADHDRATVIGTKGEIEFHDQRSPLVETYRDEVSSRRHRRAGEINGESGNDAWRNLLMEFRDIIREDRAPSPSASDMRAALEMVLAAQEAARTGRRVTFPFKEAVEPAARTRSLSPSQAFAWLSDLEPVHAS